MRDEKEFMLMRDLGFEITDFKYIGYDTQTLFHPSSLIP